MSAGPEAARGSAVLVHGTAIAVDGRGVLIRGRPGMGKSDLALRAIGSVPSEVSPYTIRLVSDDQVLIGRGPAGLMMSAPAPIHGKLEVRGVGLVDLGRMAVAEEPVRLVLAIDLVHDLSEIERLPEPYEVEILGNRIAALKLFPFEVSAVEKLRLAVRGAPSGPR